MQLPVLALRPCSRWTTTPRAPTHPHPRPTSRPPPHPPAQALDPSSSEFQAEAWALPPEAWERVAASFVREKPAAECRSFYMHTLRPVAEWGTDESSALQRLVAKYGGYQVRV
jgi:hypothetical protein